jgi:hypothetical protein
VQIVPGRFNEIHQFKRTSMFLSLPHLASQDKAVQILSLMLRDHDIEPEESGKVPHSQVSLIL